MAKKEVKKPDKAAKPPKPPKGKKDKKGKGAPGGIPSAGSQSFPLANMSPEQMTAAQIEQAIKESNDPNTRLKKLRSPFNLRSCLLNILVLIVATFGIFVFWCSRVMDRFDFMYVMADMMQDFQITQFFVSIGDTIRGWFGG